MQKRKHNRIRNLKCYKRVYELIAAGKPYPAIAKFIQDQGECNDIQRVTLIVRLKEFGRDMVLCDKLSTRLPHVVVDAQTEFADKLAELRRLEKQYEAQLYRFDAAHAEERMSDEISNKVDRIQRTLITLITAMHSIKMDLGLSGGRDLGTLTVSAARLEEIKQKYGDGASKAMADPVSRGKILSIMKAASDAARLEGQSHTIIDVHPEEKEESISR